MWLVDCWIERNKYTVECFRSGQETERQFCSYCALNGKRGEGGIREGFPKWIHTRNRKDIGTRTDNRYASSVVPTFSFLSIQVQESPDTKKKKMKLEIQKIKLKKNCWKVEFGERIDRLLRQVHRHSPFKLQDSFSHTLGINFWLESHFGILFSIFFHISCIKSRDVFRAHPVTLSPHYSPLFR